MEQEKISALREVRKLNDILNTWGDVLVPTLEGQTETTASQRLLHFLDILKFKYGIDTETKLLNEFVLLNEIF